MENSINVVIIFDDVQIVLLVLGGSGRSLGFPRISLGSTLGVPLGSALSISSTLLTINYFHYSY